MPTKKVALDISARYAVRIRRRPNCVVGQNELRIKCDFAANQLRSIRSHGAVIDAVQ